MGRLKVYDDINDRWVYPASGSGSVEGASSSTDNAIARFDGTTGKTIQNSAVTIADNGNTIFGTNSDSGTTTPVNVSYGGTYGTNAFGNPGNLKWDMYNDGAGNRYGIGMSSGNMEYQAGAGGGHAFFTNQGSLSVLIDGATNFLRVATPGTGTDSVTSNGGTQTLTNKRITVRTNTTTSSATPTINTDTTDEFTITALAANITSMTTNLSGTPSNGDELMIRIKGTGTRTITWGASFVSSGVATLLATTSGTNTHYVKLRYDSTAAKWVCMAVDATGY